MTTPPTLVVACPVRMVNMSTTRVTVWGENYHEHAERDRAAMAERYPDGMHGAIAAGLREVLGDAVEVRTATRDQPEHGLTADILDSTDVLTWWGHARHGEIADAVVDRVYRRVLGGMGLLVLHSGHFSKIFTRLMGTTCSLAWRNSADTELVWTVSPAHPIARGVPHPIVIEEQEMYGEYFDIPAPDELVFLSTFSSGEVFRSGCCWRRGKGRVFYFSPGDQDYPVYHHPDIRRVLANAVQWATPDPDLGVDPPGVVARPAPRFASAVREPV
jgi:trehalose utilization protein